MADNEAIARSFFDDLCNGRRLDLAPQLLAPNHRYHDPNAPAEDGPDGMVAALKPYQDDINGRWEVHDVVAAGDKVTVRWTGHGKHDAELNGIPPTGKEIHVEALSLLRFEDGKIAENWTVWDTLGMLQQIGVVPPPPS